MKVRAIALLAFSLIMSFNTLAIDCHRGKVTKLFLSPNNGNDSGFQLNAYFDDGKKGIWKKAPHQIDEKNLDRMYSLLLTAQSTGKSVRVRYSDDVVSCDQLAADNYTFTALWLMN
ncbi:hypothetical protein [Vibrio mediterranei]|uniref:hypothetical protein n=1 Tax=Vibrio mediterranei TaxID=689 RepID=UPI00148CEFA3|nr:hypothetical protein [Vibrio mediterranei]NOH29410.1 hypothetical protein [Vibrio mediterranei]